jgi:hypothetical protein
MSSELLLHRRQCVGWAKARQRRAHAFLLGATTWARRFRGFAHATIAGARGRYGAVHRIDNAELA